MLTALISAVIIGVLGYFGITLSAAQMAATVIVVKILVVATIALIGWRVSRRRQK